MLNVCGCERVRACNHGSDATQTEGLLLIQPIRLWCHLSAICHWLPVCPAPVSVTHTHTHEKQFSSFMYLFISILFFKCCNYNEKQCCVLFFFFFHKHNHHASFLQTEDQDQLIFQQSLGKCTWSDLVYGRMARIRWDRIMLGF